MRDHDIVIGGGGLTGLILARTLAGALGDGVRIAVIDPDAPGTRADPRSYALSAGSKRLLDAIAVWPALAAVTGDHQTGAHAPTASEHHGAAGGIAGEADRGTADARNPTRVHHCSRDRPMERRRRHDPHAGLAFGDLGIVAQ